MVFSFGVLIANQFDMILHYRKRLRFLRISFLSLQLAIAYHAIPTLTNTHEKVLPVFDPTSKINGVLLEISISNYVTLG